MSVWRMLSLNTFNAYMNMAIDEAILEAKIKGVAPNTIRFYRWNPSAVSIGRFQELENAVHIENCRESNVDVVRRISGGGAVYHDSSGEITYSVVADKESLRAKNALEVYARVYSGIVQALEILGLTATFHEGDAKACPNLTIAGRKISGSAQCHRSDVVLQHGTLLLNVNLEKMFTFLKVHWAKTCAEVVEVAKGKITSITMEIGRGIQIEDVYHALVEGFQETLGITLKKGNLTDYEKALAERLCMAKYSTQEWNLHGRIRSESLLKIK
ncbi:MAG: lipoate--protein ligase family protein [Candidatus Bathyarchaeota archaeon]|nr:lipoate--protein ligase family protein [Candidatus Bathyarchaeota archaeon]MCX8177474.1 lipoate--protein ligase family protein [Candidatus Bathyarchaeota archaeon]MDW8194141.1 biotin/lipoate A/B protein ligase family protein [Nitrososphaerota archaeon]